MRGVSRRGNGPLLSDLPFLHYGSSTLKQASEKEAIIIRRGAQRNRERFKAKYGCLPGTPEYEKLFSEDQFGIDDPNKRLKRQERLGIGECGPGSIVERIETLEGNGRVTDQSNGKERRNNCND